MKSLKKINGEIRRLSMPAILTNISVPLLGLADTAISGHLGSGAYLGGVAVGSMMLNVAYWLFGFLRMGTTGLTAEALGASATEKTRELFTRALLVALLIGTAVILFQKPLSWLLLEIISPSPEVRELALGYFLTASLGAPALLSMQAANGWMVGMQSTARPMVVTIVMNIVNILLSLTLVYGFGLGFKGIAWGTVISQWCGLALSVWLARGLAPGHRLLVPLKRLRGNGTRKYLTVNGNLFFRSFCVMGVSLAVNAFGARNGDLCLAVNAVMMQFFFFFSYFMDGIAFAGEAMVGKYSGAGDRESLSATLKGLFRWGAFLTALFTVIYAAAWEPVAKLLTDVAEVREALTGFRHFIWLIPAAGAAAFILDGIYIGLTRTGAMFRTTLLSTIAFFLIVSLPLVTRAEAPGGFAGNSILWWAYLAYLFLRGALLLGALPRTLDRMRLSRITHEAA